jgi:hypothetical protein
LEGVRNRVVTTNNMFLLHISIDNLKHFSYP